MNYPEMTPKQLGWYISDHCELPKLGAFIEQKMEELLAMHAKCIQQQAALVQRRERVKRAMSGNESAYYVPAIDD